MKATNKITIREKSYFICDYTGAPCEIRYFVPTGRDGKGKSGCYATLPVLLRHQYELQGNRFTTEYGNIKRSVQTYYQQPDIPMQPALPIDEVPLSEGGLALYLTNLPLGLSWTLVEGGVNIDPEKNKRQKKKSKIVSDELPPTQPNSE